MMNGNGCGCGCEEVCLIMQCNVSTDTFFDTF